MNKRKGTQRPGIARDTAERLPWSGAVRWDVWKHDPIPRHREGANGFVVRALKKLYLAAMGPFHRELLRRQRALNLDLVASLASLEREVAALRREAGLRPERHRQLFGEGRLVSPTEIGSEVNDQSTGPFRVRPAIEGEPLVSIVIPTKDHVDDLERCINSIMEKSTYRPIEVIVVDHESVDPRTLRSFKSERFRVVREDGPFNFSRLINAGARQAKGDVLLVLNNDTIVIEPDWIQAMLEHAARPDVGVVGAKLLFPSGRIQHAGMTVPDGEVFPVHTLLGVPDDRAAFGALAVARNCIAVTGACLMVRRDLFEKVGGFDEHYSVELGDVDLCLRLWAEGYRTVWTPDAVLTHREFGTRRRGESHEGDRTRFLVDWGRDLMRGDPFFHAELLGPRHEEECSR
ncbi:MAG: glycosyltransferase family 2 protein [Deltaproteobacteria bacterium]|nr:glycosyltransferase family 2 protein [Deltaproteobacteria bacterium]